MSKSDLYQSVTDRIIAALQAGTPPWVCPWAPGPGLAAPANLGSGRPYRGINVLLLNLQAATRGYALNRWLTYRQALALGAQVRRGEEGTPVVFFKMLEVEGAAASCVDDDAGIDRKVVPLLRAFTVFNAAQIEGLPSELLPAPSAPDWSPLAAAEEVLLHSGAVIHHGGVQAYYSPVKDLIGLPEPARFTCAEDYYRVALHELTHWSGHAARCNRPLQGRQHIEAYAFEELVAEMGSAFLCGHCGLPASLQHASYVDHWLQALRNDRRLIFTAAALAQKASDYLLAGLVQPEAEMALPAPEVA